MAIPTGFGGRDYPDFGVSGLKTSKVVISDMSELAVRMGSINRFDRLGSVLFQDAFEHGLVNWNQNAYPAGAYAVPSGRYFSIVPHSALMATTTALNSYSGLNMSLPIPYVSAMGFEFHVKVMDDIDNFRCSFNLYTGSYRYWVEVRIDTIANEIDFYNEAGGFTVISTDDIYFGLASPFHIIKIVADLVNENYVRLVVDGIDYNLRAYKLNKAVSTTTPRLYCLFINMPLTASVQRVCLDNVIITMDEPT